MFEPIRPRPTMPSSLLSVATPAPFREHRSCEATSPRVSPGGYAARINDVSDADALVIFGITGDLARRMTLPALYRLTEEGHLSCTVLTVGRRPLSEDELRDLARKA